MDSLCHLLRHITKVDGMSGSFRYYHKLFLALVGDKR